MLVVEAVAIALPRTIASIDNTVTRLDNILHHIQCSSRHESLPYVHDTEHILTRHQLVVQLVILRNHAHPQQVIITCDRRREEYGLDRVRKVVPGEITALRHKPVTITKRGKIPEIPG